jgi:hypothetical protein
VADKEAVVEDYDPNVIDDPALEIEEPKAFDPSNLEAFDPDDIRADPDFQRAMANAQKKQYDHTFFEIFEEQIEGILRATEAPLTVEVADSILRTWPWFKYYDIEPYLVYRVRMLKEVLHELHESFPKPREILFKENIDDWQQHREGYIELMARWTALNNRWAVEWTGLKMGDKKRSILHAALVDLVYLTLGPEGMIEKFQYLLDFDNPEFIVTEKEQEALGERIRELTGE